MKPRSAVWLAMVSFSLVTSAALSSDSFFTGRRAEAIALLKESNRPGINAESAMDAIARARKAADGLDDPYVDFVIEARLAQVYQYLGDPDAAAAHLTVSTERLNSGLKRDGVAQGMYTYYLVGYDIDRPATDLFRSGDSEFGQVGEFEEKAKQLRQLLASRLEKGDLSPKEASALKRFADMAELIANDLGQGLFQKDVKRLRRARDNSLRFMKDERAYSASVGGELDPQDIYDITTEMYRRFMDMAIAMVERNRKAFEKAARHWAGQVNKLLSLAKAENDK